MLFRPCLPRLRSHSSLSASNAPADLNPPFKTALRILVGRVLGAHSPAYRHVRRAQGCEYAGFGKKHIGGEELSRAAELLSRPIVHWVGKQHR